MKKTKITIAAIALPLVLAGCQTTQDAFSNNCKVTGTALGAVVGGIAGAALGGKNAVVAGLIGATAGALIGNQIGAMLDCEDQKAAAVSTQQAGDAPTGHKIYWASTTAEPQAKQALQEQQTQQAAQASLASQAKPAKPKPKPKADQTASQTPPKADTSNSAWKVQEPAQSAAGNTQNAWSVQEPVASAGNSGMWGWSEPVGESYKDANGRTCRQLRQVVVDKSGKQTAQDVNSCLDQNNNWVVAAAQ